MVRALCAVRALCVSNRCGLCGLCTRVGVRAWCVSLVMVTSSSTDHGVGDDDDDGDNDGDDAMRRDWHGWTKHASKARLANKQIHVK